LPVESISSLAVAGQNIFAATGKGAFHYKDGRWLPLYKGMETSNVNFLARGGNGILYAATDQGIFFMHDEKALAEGPQTALAHLEDQRVEDPRDEPIQDRRSNEVIFESYASLQDYFHGEPSIREAQEMGVQYAEVNPKKIANWRRAAQTRSLLPTVSTNVGRSASELFHWDSGPNPDILAKGRDYMDWGVSMSWDLADLIWNPDQTSIDSRSKLMVELREDILDQITRLYFERRRLQVELMASVLEPQFKIDKEMRVEELTAMIDALTGGEFSRLMQKPKEMKPEEKISD
jgi:hypothetical protein